MKKIVIIGSSGFLGLNLYLQLNKKYKIFPFVNKKKIQFKKFNFISANFKNKNSLLRSIKKINPDYIINCAAFSNIEKCEINKKKTIETNTFLASSLANICKKLSIHYTFISTDHLFSDKNKIFKETDKVDPINIYAKSKILAENRIKKFFKKSLILRTNFYGFGPKFRASSLVDKIIENFKNKRKVYLLEDVHFTPIFVNQFVKILDLLLKNNQTGTFHISGNQRLTKFEFGEKISKKFKFDKNLLMKLYLNDINQKVLRPPEMSLSNKKIKKIIHDNKLFDLSEGISQLYKIYKSGYYKNIKKIK